MAVARMRIVARIGPRRSPHGNFVLGSLAAHAVFVALLLLLPGLRRKPTFQDAYVVQLAAPAAKRAAAPAAPAPQPRPVPPKPKPPAEGVRVETAKPKKVETTKPKPEPPAPQPAADLETDAEAEAAAASAGAEAESATGGGSISSPEGWDNELAWYRNSVTAALYSNWQRPILSGNRETLEVTVDFEILRSGDVAQLRVTSSSGVPSLDRSALRAVADASPLPPVPAQWKETVLPARFIFQLHPEEY